MTQELHRRYKVVTLLFQHTVGSLPQVCRGYKRSDTRGTRSLHCCFKTVHVVQTYSRCTGVTQELQGCYIAVSKPIHVGLKSRLQMANCSRVATRGRTISRSLVGSNQNVKRFLKAFRRLTRTVLTIGMKMRGNQPSTEQCGFGYSTSTPYEVRTWMCASGNQWRWD